MVQLPQRRIDKSILFTPVQLRRHTHNLRLPFRLIHSPHDRLCRTAIVPQRAGLGEDDEVPLSLRFIGYGEAEEVGDVFGAEREFYGAGCWVQEADLLLGEVLGAADELEAEFFAGRGGEGDVFAVEPEFGIAMEVEVEGCCAVVF